jgi:hypothetical protein
MIPPEGVPIANVAAPWRNSEGHDAFNRHLNRRARNAFDAHAEAAMRPESRRRSEKHKAAPTGGPFAATVRGIAVCLELCIAVVLAVTLGALAARPEWIELMAAAAVFLPATLIYAAWTMRR